LFDPVLAWIAGIDPDPALYGTHSFRGTKAILICRWTGILRAVQFYQVIVEAKVPSNTLGSRWMAP